MDELLKEILLHLEHAPIDYANGVVHNGVDEGNVYGWEAHSEIVDKIRTVLGIPEETADNIETWAKDNKLPFKPGDCKHGLPAGCCAVCIAERAAAQDAMGI